VWQGEGASVLRSLVRAPNATAVAERWVRTLRSECTAGLLIRTTATSDQCWIATSATTTNTAPTAVWR
jgi:hypothetical protein